MAVIVQLSRYGGVVRGLARGRGRWRRGKRGTPYDRLYREAPPERGPFDWLTYKEGHLRGVHIMTAYWWPFWMRNLVAGNTYRNSKFQTILQHSCQGGRRGCEETLMRTNGRMGAVETHIEPKFQTMLQTLYSTPNQLYVLFEPLIHTGGGRGGGGGGGGGGGELGGEGNSSLSVPTSIKRPSKAPEHCLTLCI